EEVEQANQTFRRLIGLPWTDREGATRPLAAEDVLVVAPYNAQVRRLIETLPRGARVGTVDKFQGQQAPAVIYSMAIGVTGERAFLPAPWPVLIRRDRGRAGSSGRWRRGVFQSHPCAGS